MNPITLKNIIWINNVGVKLFLRHTSLCYLVPTSSIIETDSITKFLHENLIRKW